MVFAWQRTLPNGRARWRLNRFAEDLRVWRSVAQALDEVWQAFEERRMARLAAEQATVSLGASNHDAAQEGNTKADQSMAL